MSKKQYTLDEDGFMVETIASKYRSKSKHSIDKCTYCGGSAEVVEENASVTIKYTDTNTFVRCRQCGARGPVFYSKTGEDNFKEKAVKAWNEGTYAIIYGKNT